MANTALTHWKAAIDRTIRPVVTIHSAFPYSDCLSMRDDALLHRSDP